MLILNHIESFVTRSSPGYLKHKLLAKCNEKNQLTDLLEETKFFFWLEILTIFILVYSFLFLD